MLPLLSIAVFAAVLVLIQVVAALPWLIVLLRTPNRSWLKWVGLGLAGIVALRLGKALLAMLVALPSTTDPVLEYLGRAYGSLLHLQLAADLFIGVFWLLLRFWPKGAAVALAAFREGIRQPMFWLIVGFALVVMAIIPFVPYFTFGEDYLMVKELGQDIIMLMALVFGAILASTSISEEIEGRTAVTLMSKPVSRREFLLGKYVGILLAVLVVTALLGWFFDWMLLFTRWYDTVDPVPFPPRAAALVNALSPTGDRAFLRGAMWWVMDAAEVLPGLVLGFGQVMILLAVAVCLATRLPVAANVTICAVVYV
ncbi:MAG: ABC transporter permease, partial [Nevskiales bacterium]